MKRHGARLLLAMHKPFGFLSPSTKPLGNKRFALDLLTLPNQSHNTIPWRPPGEPRTLAGLACAAPLDADSTGLMLWTDDYELLQHLSGRRSLVEKEYLVRVSGHEQWAPEQLQQSVQWMASGVAVDGVTHKPASVKWLNEAQLRMTLCEGKHRQIRRMCEVVGLKVEAQKRTRIGCITLGALKLGKWKVLPESLVSQLLGEASGNQRSMKRNDTARRETHQDQRSMEWSNTSGSTERESQRRMAGNSSAGSSSYEPRRTGGNNTAGLRPYENHRRMPVGTTADSYSERPPLRVGTHTASLLDSLAESRRSKR
ncbi:hypothetical protein AB1Y20_009312 [Prymnesium parvum]|uniref:Pseudouridine synthase RsuA/RluA-like domain-containing protein n=1 Tax=Prymnesium parvum TaxID=97485 RepID=A0AB34K4Q6_PRYPA